MNRKHSCQSAETTVVESTRTIGSAERCSCPVGDGAAGREIDIPGDGPPATGVKRIQQESISPQGREAKNGSDCTRFLTVCYSSQYQEREDKTDEEELVEDILKIVTVFSARLYGKRGGKKVRKKTKEGIEECQE